MPVFGFSDKYQKRLIEWAIGQNDGDAGHIITRVSMYKALTDKFASEVPAMEQTLLAISRSEVLVDVLGLSGIQKTDANYPEYNLIDLHQFEADSFDYCVSDQVFEHIEGNPFQAFRESVRVTRPGGRICHTTCFINPIHGHPSDFWRFTPQALELMAKEAGCVEIETGGWGNREAWGLIEAGFRRVRIPNDPRHPLHRLAVANDLRWPIVVWVTARKPAEGQPA